MITSESSQESPQGILKGKRILVTGGSRGIGAAIVRILAQKGASVAFTYSSNEASARALLSELPGTGHQVLAMDVSSEDSVQTGITQVLNHWEQKLNGVVNNAGITKDSLLLRMKTEDFQRVLQTNLTGSFLVCRMALKALLKADSASIVNVSSVVASQGNAGQANYAASKGGVEAFTRSLAKEIASRQVRVNSVAPGFIETDMTAALTEEQKKALLTHIPMQRIAQPEEVAYAVAFLLGDESRYITGQTLHVNGGLWMG